MTERFLHVACGPATKADVAVANFRDWDEVRCDLDPKYDPDVVDDMRGLFSVASDSFEGVYCSHALEHVHCFDWGSALGAFWRVLKRGGLLFAIVPNFEAACRRFSFGDRDAMYESPAGPIFAHEVIFGKENWVHENPLMQHRSGFSPDLLRGAVLGAGFRPVHFTCDDLNIMIGAVKP